MSSADNLMFMIAVNEKKVEELRVAPRDVDRDAELSLQGSFSLSSFSLVLIGSRCRRPVGLPGCTSYGAGRMVCGKVIGASLRWRLLTQTGMISKPILMLVNMDAQLKSLI